MIIAMLRLKPAAGYEKSVVSALKVISVQTEGTPGCMQSLLYREADECDRLCYLVLWNSDEDLRRHLRTKNFRKLLSLIEASADAPELDFFHVIQHTGLGIVSDAGSDLREVNERRLRLAQRPATGET